MKEVRGDDMTVKCRDRRQPRRAVCRRIPGRVDAVIRDALQVFVDDDAARVLLDAGGIKIQVIDLGHASRAVDDDVSFDLPRLLRCLCVDDERGS